MINISNFKLDNKFSELSQFIVNCIMKIDSELEVKGYKYKAIWRADRAPGGHVFIFEVDKNKGRRKNLITLRPHQRFLRVEVYREKNIKHYFDIYDIENFPDGLMDEIEYVYHKIYTK